MISHFTLCFPDYATARSAAIALGFWTEPEPIYEQVSDPNAEPGIRAYYRDVDTGEEEMYPFVLPEDQAESEGLELLRTEEVSSPAYISVQTGMTDGALRTNGQGENPDGSWFGWSIDEIGQISTPGTYDEEGNELTPPVPIPGYWINVAGKMPEGSDAVLSEYVRPYGSAGRVFAGTTPDNN